MKYVVKSQYNIVYRSVSFAQWWCWTCGVRGNHRQSHHIIVLVDATTAALYWETGPTPLPSATESCILAC